MSFTFFVFLNHGNESVFQKSKLRKRQKKKTKKTGVWEEEQQEEYQDQPFTVQSLLAGPCLRGPNVHVMRLQNNRQENETSEAFQHWTIRPEYKLCMYNMFKEIKEGDEHMSEGQKNYKKQPGRFDREPNTTSGNEKYNDLN